MSKKYKNQSTNNIIRGFTLVELLAVIVILALIALITAPVVLNVIESSRDKTYKRSIDHYGAAVQKAVAEYMMDNERETGRILTYNDIKKYIKYEGNDVTCNIVEIYEDKTVYLSECKINTDTEYIKNSDGSPYTYGKRQTQSNN